MVLDLARVQAKSYADNIIGFLVGRLIRLPAKTQEALGLLACLGATADVATLAIVMGTSDNEIDAVLGEAARHELVEQVSGRYRFVHDRVQDAACSLIPKERRSEAHLRIGRLLVQHTPSEGREEAIFEIVGQLNRGAALITVQEEREQLAELNLIAGRRAKTSIAYDSALNYLVAGSAMLPQEAWDHRRDLAFMLQLSRAECEFLTGAFSEADARLALLAQRAATHAERVTIAGLRIDLYMTMGQGSRAVDVGIAFLGGLGIELSTHPTDAEARREYEDVRSLIGNRTVDELLDSPLMTDPASLEILDVLTKLSPAALFADANLHCIVGCKAVCLSLKRGYGDGSCPTFEWLALVAGPRFGDYKTGFLLGQVGYALVEQQQSQRSAARTYMLFGAHVIPWVRHINTGRDVLRSAFDAAEKSGDIVCAQSSLLDLTSLFIASGDPLPDVYEHCERSLEYALKIPSPLRIDLIVTQLALIKTLRGLTQRFGCFDDGQFAERRMEQRFPSASDTVPGRHLRVGWDKGMVECRYWIRKLQARFFAEDYGAALDALFKAQPLLWATEFMFESAEYHFYSALTRMACYERASDEERREILNALAVHSEELRIRAESCSDNFESRAVLVAAEVARIEGRELDAERQYELAVGLLAVSLDLPKKDARLAQ